MLNLMMIKIHYKSTRRSIKIKNIKKTVRYMIDLID